MTEKKKLALCCPFLERPTDPLLESLERAVPLLNECGWEDIFIQERGCPYISAARAKMLRKALDNKCETIVFLDYDLSFEPEDLLKLVEAQGDVVAGTYRFKKEPEEYMGTLRTDGAGNPLVRADGAVLADWVPAGFLKVTLAAVRKFMKTYPQLVYGYQEAPCVDLFNHGAIDGTWYGEDYAFSKRWNDAGGKIWIIPDLDLNHHSRDKCFVGNFHKYLMKLPGGCKAEEAACQSK